MAIWFHGVEPFGAILMDGIMRNISVNLFIFNLDQRVRCTLKIFLIYSSGGHFVQLSRTICAILVEGIMRNTFVKLF